MLRLRVKVHKRGERSVRLNDWNDDRGKDVDFSWCVRGNGLKYNTFTPTVELSGQKKRWKNGQSWTM